MEIVLFFIIFWGPLAFGSVEPWALGILECASFLALSACCGRRRFTSASAVYKTLLPAVLILLALGLIQWCRPALSGDLRVVGPFTASRYDTRNALLLWGAYASLLLCVPQALRTPDDLRRFHWALFGIGVGVALIGIIQAMNHPRLIYGFRPVNELEFYAPFGPYYNRDSAASLMAMSTLMGCGVFFSRFYAPAESGNIGEVADFLSTQGLIGFALVAIVIGIVLSGSRAGFCLLLLGACGGIFLSTYDWRHRHRAWIARAALMLAATAAVIAFTRANPKFKMLARNLIGQATDASLADRLSMYRSGLEMISDSPLFGWGGGAFATVFPLYRDPARFPDVRIDHLHSDWLELVVETGCVGFGIIALGLVLLMVGALRSWAACGRRDLRELRGWALCAVGVFLLHCLADFPFHIPADAATFLMIACCLGMPLSPGSEAESELTARTVPSRVFLAALFLGGGVLSATAIRPVVASWYLHRSFHAPAVLRPALLEDSIAWDPRPEYQYRAAAAYLSLADSKGDASKDPRMRDAWNHEQAALRGDRWNIKFVRMQAFLLNRFGRGNDANALLETGRLTRPRPD